MSTISAPDFLTTNLKFGEVVPSSQSLSYTCTDSDKMLPNSVDLDSNFALEVDCVDGKYIAPLWPEQCEPEAVCSTIPNPPDADIVLVRADNGTKYRAGEQVKIIGKKSAQQYIHIHIQLSNSVNIFFTFLRRSILFVLTREQF